MKLSIVATLYQSAPYIQEFYARASAAAEKLVGEDYEIVLVNDGSPDNSLELAVQLTEQDQHIVVVDLSRNFGHHKAMMTGLAHATGERVFLIDSDLEEEPEWLLDFSRQMENEACDVVYGVQEKRKGGWFEQLTGSMFWELIIYLSGCSIDKNQVTARLMNKLYVSSLLKHQESEIFIAGLFFITGFDQKPKIVNKSSISLTTYNLRRKLSLFINSVTSFSNLPLVGIFYFGVIISSLSLIYIVYLLIGWFFLSTSVLGWTSVIVSLWLLGGLIISFIGVVGIYLSKVFIEVKNRPNSIIRKIYGA